MKTGRIAVIAAVIMTSTILSGCLSSARKQVAPESWVRADGTGPATQADTEKCRPYLEGSSLDNLDAHLATFRECMRDHGFKMK